MATEKFSPVHFRGIVFGHNRVLERPCLGSEVLDVASHSEIRLVGCEAEHRHSSE
jgi:hypothetical protein